MPTKTQSEPKFADWTEDEATITIDVANLVGMSEIELRLIERGYSFDRSNISTWIDRRRDRSQETPKRASNGFPEPIVQLAMGGLYDWAEILDWVTKKYGRA